MKKKNVFLMLAVAVVFGLSILTSTLLAGCGTKRSINTVNVYSDSVKYEIDELKGHKENLKDASFEVSYAQKRVKEWEVGAGLAFANFTESSNEQVKYLDVSDNGTVILTKEVDGVQKKGVYSFKTGSLVISYEYEEIELVGEFGDLTYYAVTKSENGETKTSIINCENGLEVEFCEGLEGAELIGVLKDGKKRFELWNVKNEDGLYFELQEINKKGERNVVWETRLDDGDPLWVKSVMPLGMYLGLGTSNGVVKLNKDIINYVLIAKLADKESGFEIYDMKKGKYLGSVGIDTSSVSGGFVVGNSLIIQPCNEVPANCNEDYDFVDNNGKAYKMSTLSLNLKTQKVKEIKDFDYVIANNPEVYAENDNDYVLVNAYKIEDGYLNKDGNRITLQLNESMKVKELPCIRTITKITDERFLVHYDGESNEFYEIVDRKFEKVCSLNSAIGQVEITEIKIEAVSGMIAICDDGSEMWGVLDSNGKVVANFEYDHFETMANGKILLSKNIQEKGTTTAIEYYVIDKKTDAVQLLRNDVKNSKVYFKGAEVSAFGVLDGMVYTKTTTDSGAIYTIYNLLEANLGSLTGGASETIVSGTFGKDGRHVAVMLVSEGGTANAKIVDILTYMA